MLANIISVIWELPARDALDIGTAAAGTTRLEGRVHPLGTAPAAVAKYIVAVGFF